MPFDRLVAAAVVVARVFAALPPRGRRAAGWRESLAVARSLRQVT
jgi:hypothetical protein